MIVVRDGPYRRPHPVVWRAVLGTNFIYWCLLSFLYFQDLDFARKTVMPFFDSSLGVPYHHRAFNENCDFTYENVKVRFRIAGGCCSS
jgi:phosphatidylserine synthase 2